MKNKEKLAQVWQYATDRRQEGADAETVIAELQSKFGAIVRRGDPNTLRVAGVVSSCTSDATRVLLSNWLNTANQRLIMSNY
jgi:hypothetical protein